MPAGVAVVTSLGSVILLGVLLPAAGAALACCLVLAGVVTPWLAARAAARTEARGAAARGEVTALSLEILEDSAPLRVSGRFDARLAELDAADARLSAVADDGARTSGLAAALGALAQGLAVLASLAFGIPATLAGTLSVEALSVVVLTPLAVFEATAGLPAAAVQLRRSREAARRLLELTGPGVSGASGTSGRSRRRPARARRRRRRLARCRRHAAHRRRGGVPHAAAGFGRRPGRTVGRGQDDAADDGGGPDPAVGGGGVRAVGRCAVRGRGRARVRHHGAGEPAGRTR